MTWWYSRAAGLVARGYQPPMPEQPDLEWVLPAQVGEGDLVVFCPTVTIDGNADPQAEALTQIAGQLRGGVERGTLPPCVLLVGVHHDPARRGDAHARLDALRTRLDGSLRLDGSVRLAAFCTTTPGKVTALNAAIDVALRARAVGLLQLDDDIRIEDGALDALYTAYRGAGHPLAVGATKIGISRPTWTSRLMRWSKSRTRTAVDYPHACCMLLDPRLVAPGVPTRYVSDDAYICFALLRPELPDPRHLLRLVPQARCVHYVGGAAGQAARRVRGLLLNTHVLLADFPAEVSRYYFRELLFPGFWPLGSRPRRWRPLSWATQALYFTWFLAVGLELALRGAAGRPLRDIGWRPVPDRALPRMVVPA